MRGLVVADARDEFLGHLLENGEQHAQPTLATAGAQLTLQHPTLETAQNGQVLKAELTGSF